MDYEQLIEYSRHKNQGEYTHKHHVIPKCLGGSNRKDNIIELSWLTHYYAHKLLAEENPDNKELQKAFKKMGDIDTYLKKCYMSSVVPVSEDRKKKMSENHVDVSGENNPFYGKHHTDEARKSISEKMSGKSNATGKHWKLSDESKQKMSESHKGKKYNTTLKHWKLVDGKRVYF